MKCVEECFELIKCCRSPCGERGLKSCSTANSRASITSLPVRGAWIEIATSSAVLPCIASLPVRGAWIEIFLSRYPVQPHRSLPVRGAWIEMICLLTSSNSPVGRSPCGERGLKFLRVRHIGSAKSRSPCGERGLKCHFGGNAARCKGSSLPVRGAWIEMSTLGAMLKSMGMSLPVRGAWIEM